MLSQQLPGAAQGSVPGQRFIDIKTQKQEHVHAHGGSSDDAAVTDDIFEIADEHQLDKDHRVNAAMSFGAIIGCSGFVEPFKIEQLLEPAIEIIFGYPLTQPKR